jgi:DNA processing protein
MSTDREYLRPAVRLSLVPGVGPRIRRALLDAFETPEAVLAAAPSDLRRVPGVGAKLCQAIAKAEQSIDADAEIELCRQHGIDMLVDGEALYPRQLREVPDPPGLL